MNFEEFLTDRNQPEKEAPAVENAAATDAAETAAPAESAAPAETAAEEEEVVDSSVELDVQKAVVESLAADKAEQSERIAKLLKENYRQQSEISALNEQIAGLKEQLAKMGDILVKNVEHGESSMVTLLDRPFELADRFEGETRDHLLEVIAETRDRDEKDGRVRRAQLMEGILVANQPTGNLAKKRKELENLFAMNNNILSGEVINSLDKLGISYKKGEEYLLTKDIIQRTY